MLSKHELKHGVTHTKSEGPLTKASHEPNANGVIFLEWDGAIVPAQSPNTFIFKSLTQFVIRTALQNNIHIHIVTEQLSDSKIKRDQQHKQIVGMLKAIYPRIDWSKQIHFTCPPGMTDADRRKHSKVRLIESYINDMIIDRYPFISPANLLFVSTNNSVNDTLKTMVTVELATPAGRHFFNIDSFIHWIAAYGKDNRVQSSDKQKKWFNQCLHTNQYPKKDNPFNNFKSISIAQYKKITISLLEQFIANETKDSTLSVRIIHLLIKKIKSSMQFRSIKTHYEIHLSSPCVHAQLNNFITYLNNSSLFKTEVYQEYAQLDRFNNPVETSHFESVLAHQILQAAPTKALEKVNAAILDFCKKHAHQIDAKTLHNIQDDLIKYKFCIEENFKNKNPVEKFIELLKRPLSDPKNISECSTLHLVFFDFNHFYDPTLAVKEAGDAKVLHQKRESLHGLIRPNREGEMFHDITRGRQPVQFNQRTCEFGITDSSYIGSWAQSWHRYPFTPHKYRATPNPNSLIVNTFRNNRIPFIAGPSGTTADCLEGLTLLLPELSNSELKEYFNLLAAAEVAQGHHSIHEVILTLANRELFLTSDNEKKFDKEDAEARRKSIWEHLDYTRTYESFLSDAFKKTKQYQEELLYQFPQFLSPSRHVAQQAEAKRLMSYVKPTIKIQRLIRAYHAYGELEQGPGWKRWNEAKNFYKGTMRFSTLRQLSRNNIAVLEKQVLPLSPSERPFMRALRPHNYELTHYTNSSHAVKKSGYLLSNSALNRRRITFENMSISDAMDFANGGFVYFRLELKHLPDKTSRFGEDQFVFPGNAFSHAWVSLYETFNPRPKDIVINDSKTVVRRLSNPGIPLENGTFKFVYTNHTEELDLARSIFYGKDIMYGVALAALRELRRIGHGCPAYQNQKLTDLSLEGLNKTLYELFRIEGKIPGQVFLENTRYRWTSPLRMERAIMHGNIHEVKQLVGNGMSPNEIIDKNYNVALLACSLSNDNGIQFLDYLNTLEEKIQLSQGLTSGAHLAAKSGSQKCLDFCLARGNRINDLDADGKSALTLALENGHASVAASLIKKDACYQASIETLIKAVLIGNIESVRIILNKSPHLINQADINTNTVLHAAARNSDVPMLKFLFSRGAKVNYLLLRNNDGETPLSFVLLRDHAASIMLVLSKVLTHSLSSYLLTEINRPHPITGRTLIHRLVENRCEDALRYLFSSSWVTLRLDPNGESPLNTAVKQGYYEMVSLLVSKNAAMVNTPDCDGMTPLMYSAALKHKSIFLLLLDSKANVDYVNKNNEDVFTYINQTSWAFAFVRLAKMGILKPNVVKAFMTAITNRSSFEDHHEIFDNLRVIPPEIIKMLPSEIVEFNFNVVDSNPDLFLLLSSCISRASFIKYYFHLKDPSIIFALVHHLTPESFAQLSSQWRDAIVDAILDAMHSTETRWNDSSFDNFNHKITLLLNNDKNLRLEFISGRLGKSSMYLADTKPEYDLRSPRHRAEEFDQLMRELMQYKLTHRDVVKKTMNYLINILAIYKNKKYCSGVVASMVLAKLVPLDLIEDSDINLLFSTAGREPKLAKFLLDKKYEKDDKTNYAKDDKKTPGFFTAPLPSTTPVVSSSSSSSATTLKLSS